MASTRRTSVPKPLSARRAQDQINKIVSVWRYLVWMHEWSKNQDDALVLVNWTVEDYSSEQFTKAWKRADKWSRMPAEQQFWRETLK